MAASSAVVSDTRRLTDLAGIGPVFLENLHEMGITTVQQLAKRNPRDLSCDCARWRASAWIPARWTCLPPRWRTPAIRS